MESENQNTGEEQEAAMLSCHEARVLACLMEKELTVPDSYPLSLHSLMLACNQKSNREPQLNLAEGEVGHIAKELADRELIRIEYGDRVHKFEHNVRKELGINKRQQSLLTVMMLRAPQTLNELKVRTRRMVQFEDIDEIELTLESLNEEERKIMLFIPKGSGQRESRYTHLLCGEPEAPQVREVQEFEPPQQHSQIDELQAQVDALSERIAQLEAKLE